GVCAGDLLVTSVTITNPPGFAQALPLAVIDKLSVSIDLLDYLQHQTLVLPAITITHPVINARQWPDGTDNYSFSPSAGAGPSNSAAPPRIEALTITQGEARATLAKLHAAVKADFTTAQTSAQSGLLVAAATGVYAGQKLTAHFIGGALLTVSDPAKPYKIDLQVQNGGTSLSLVGSLLQPLTFGGADVKLTLAGPNMADLLPLIGVPLPATPPYKIAGMLDYAKQQIRFDHFTGQVGSSDLQGDISYTPATPRPKIVAELTSRRVDLADLGGFIGAKPGAKPAASGQHNTSEAGKLLPQTPFNLPHLKMADFDVH
ncbi:MAG TPA: AsmA family protein, partial [Acetobacteraceae bacterium]|nr:AsmA family protein [Acetobacteraceae bacterium]